MEVFVIIVIVWFLGILVKEGIGGVLGRLLSLNLRFVSFYRS